ncbi:MAG: LamG domain-containing protein [bacterium]|nr:LamG domain-containing protein [bacterium]
MPNNHHIKLTVDHTQVADKNLENFPLLVVLQNDNLKFEANGGQVKNENGKDISFCLSNDSGLDHEIETYDPASGTLRAWVNLPVLSHTTDTSFYVCTETTEATGSVWDSAHKLVCHPHLNLSEHHTVPNNGDLDITETLTVEAWVHSDEGASDAFQALVGRWALRQTMDAFESCDAGNTDGLNTKGYFGAVCDGRYVYFSPQRNGNQTQHGQVLRFDTHGAFNNPENWAAYDAGNTSGLNTKGYYGAVHAGHHIFFVPRTDGTTHHSRILRCDTRKDFRSAAAWEAYDIGNIVSYQSAGYDGRYIYLTPGYEADGTDSGRAVRFDTQSNFTDAQSYITYDAGNTDGLDAKNYDGACFDGRYIYYAPLNNRGIVLRHDTTGDFSSPKSWQALDVSSRGLHMCVGAIFDGRYIYYVPYAHSTAVRYDTQKDFRDLESWQAYDAADTSNLHTKGYDGACFDGRYIYYIPFYEGDAPKSGFHCRVLRYDTQQNFDAPAAWDAADGGAFTDPPNPGGFNGGAFDGRYAYFSPWREDPEKDETRDYVPHGKVLRYDTTGPDASFLLKYVECGHNGGLCASLPGPTFSINTANGIRNVRLNRNLKPGWHHIAGVYDGAHLTLYIDGEPEAQTPASGSILIGQADLEIGHLSGGGAPFKGRIEHVRISDVARSSAWIRTTAQNLADPAAFVRVEK